jgi:hypothetical protein
MAPGSSTWETCGSTGGAIGGVKTLSASLTLTTLGTWSFRVYDGSSTAYNTTTLNVYTSASFSLSATSFTYSGGAQGPTVVASPGTATFTTGGTLSATSVGAYTATATATGYYSGSNSGLSWTINKASQSIVFGNPGSQTYGFPVTIQAYATSGLPVTLSVVSGPATLSRSTVTASDPYCVVTATGQGNVTIRASQGGDSNINAASDVDNTFVFNNTAPDGVTLTLSGSSLVSGAQGETALYVGDSVIVSGTIHDSDGNLTVHNLSVSSDGAQTWQILPNTNSAPSDRTNSSKSVSFAVGRSGRWDFNCNGTDGLIWPTGVSKTLWVYGSDNNATVVGYTVNGAANATTVSVARGQIVPVSITLRNTENRPWTTDATPHKLVAALTGWNADTVTLPVTTVYQNQEVTFTFNVTAPSTVGTFSQQWQMAEFFNAAPTLFGGAVAVSFVVNSAPAVSMSVSSGTIAFGQTWIRPERC